MDLACESEGLQSRGTGDGVSGYGLRGWTGWRMRHGAGGPRWRS